MKNIIYILITLCFGFAQAQSTIKGRVTNTKGEFLEYAQVYLSGTTKGTITNKDGEFEIPFLEDGIYKLEIVYVGFSTFRKEVTLNGKDVVVDVILIKQTERLQEVEIIGRKTKGYRPDVTFAGTRTGANIKEVPQAISILNKEIIKDQGLFRLNQVTENIAGVTQTRTGDNFTSRGFRINHDYINGNRALIAPDFASSTIATQYERIEFIKGPAAALFGNSSPGGVINAVTKKPLDINRASITYSFGSYDYDLDVSDIKSVYKNIADTRRATADITGPLTDDKTLLYRLNLSWEDSESFRDYIENKSYLFAPSISYLPTEKTRINIDLVGAINNDQAGVDRGMPVLQEDLFALPISFSAAEPYDTRQNSQIFFTLSATHEFNDYLSFNTSYTRSDFKQNFIETRSANQFTTDGTELVRILNNRVSEGYSDFVTAYLVGTYETGIAKHEAILGWDFYETYNSGDTRSAQGEANGVPNLVFSDRVIYDDIVALDLNYNTFTTSYSVANKYRGFYIQDLITINRFKILAALRYEDLDQSALLGEGLQTDDTVDNKVFLPRFGVTYKVNENINLYASYTQAFSPQELPFGLTADGLTTFDPLESYQYEIGTKASFFQDRLLAQMSLYSINRTGRIVEDPFITGATSFIQLEEEFSRGIEVEAQGRINNNITLTANYSYNQIDVEQDIEDQNLELENNNPNHTAGFWGKYTFREGALNNLGLGLGGRYVSSSRVPAATESFINDIIVFPSYFTARMGIYYRHQNFDVSANFNNLFDERYFIGGLNAGRVFPGAPRNFLMSVGYSF